MHKKYNEKWKDGGRHREKKIDKINMEMTKVFEDYMIYL